MSTCAPATLLVGGEPRPGVRYLSLRDLHRRSRADPARFDEILLQPVLDDIDNAWSVLRALRPRIKPSGVLTVTVGPSDGTGAIGLSGARSLLRLAGFRAIPTVDSIPGTRRLRARPVEQLHRTLSCSVVVPCRNEIGNVDDVVRRLPSLGSSTELLFVDGASTDGTPNRVEQLIRDHPEKNIRLFHQHRPGGGKAAAVFQGFDNASGDVLIILDADLTVAPEDLPRFFLAICEGACRFANGSRFAYAMEQDAMPAANAYGNRAFASLFSWLLGSHIEDTLCGTKALLRADWPAIRAVGPLFGGHDPWGDFDLLLGAAYAGLDIMDVPVPYYARTAGESKMRPFRHGSALALTSLAGIRALKLRRARSGIDR